MGCCPCKVVLLPTRQKDKMLRGPVCKTSRSISILEVTISNNYFKILLRSLVINIKLKQLQHMLYFSYVLSVLLASSSQK